MKLSWDDTGASSYNLYYSAAPDCDIANYASCDDGTMVANVTSPSTVSTLTNGQNYWFQLESVAASGVVASDESQAVSNEVGTRPDQLVPNGAVKALAHDEGIPPRIPPRIPQKAILWRFSPSPDGIGDACDDDIDGEGLLNTDEENIYGTDRADRDSEDDGLTDGDEVTVYYTDPRVADSSAVNQGADSGGCFISSVQVYLYR